MIQYIPQVGEIYVEGVYIGYRDPATGEFQGVNGNTIVSDTPCADNKLIINKVTNIATQNNKTGSFLINKV